MKTHITRFLLSLLNSRWLNHSPCRYGYINNIDAFDLGNLESELKQRPDLTVAQLLKEAAAWRACPMARQQGVMVMEGASIQVRLATPEEIEEIRQMFRQT